eukprot:2137373-Prorocentrum_lima.AAC.1
MQRPTGAASRQTKTIGWEIFLRRFLHTHTHTRTLPLKLSSRCGNETIFADLNVVDDNLARRM